MLKLVQVRDDVSSVAACGDNASPFAQIVISSQIQRHYGHGASWCDAASIAAPPSMFSHFLGPVQTMLAACFGLSRAGHC